MAKYLQKLAVSANEQFLNLLVSMIMPQNWAVVPNENSHRLYTLKVGGVAPAISGSLRGHQRRRRHLFLQCQLENVCGPKGRRKSDSARAGQRICDNIFERPFAARTERTRPCHVPSTLDRKLQ